MVKLSFMALFGVCGSMGAMFYILLIPADVSRLSVVAGCGAGLSAVSNMFLYNILQRQRGNSHVFGWWSL